MSHTYDVGTKAWQPDATEGWVASEVKQKQVDGDKVKLVFTLENGEVGTHTIPYSHTRDANVSRRKWSRRPSTSSRKMP